MELHIVANRPHLVDLFEQFIYDVPDVRWHLHPSRPLTHDRHFSKAAVRPAAGVARIGVHRRSRRWLQGCATNVARLHPRSREFVLKWLPAGQMHLARPWTLSGRNLVARAARGPVTRRSTRTRSFARGGSMGDGA
jgi:hypothetical protein